MRTRAHVRERERARARDLESQSGIALENDFAEVRRRCTCDVSFVSLAFDKLLTHFWGTSAVVRGVLALRAALCSTCQRAPDFISVITPFFYYLSISYGGQGYLAVNSHRCNYTGHLSLGHPNTKVTRKCHCTQQGLVHERREDMEARLQRDEPPQNQHRGRAHAKEKLASEVSG